MRIGILTLPLHYNYGGILQAYALQTVLERMGHEVNLIVEKRHPTRLPLWKAPLSYGKRILQNMTGHPCPVFLEQKIEREFPLVSRYTSEFVNKYIKYVIYDSFNDISESDYDCFVVGSDQIWRPAYFRNIENAYLKFAEGWNVRRIAYAASFGTDKWEYSTEQTEACKRLVQRFNAVSVREASGVELCKEHFGIEAKHVLDPTMLLDKEDYIKLFKTAETPKSKGTLLNYILDETPEKTALIDKIAKDKGLVPFRVNSKVENLAAPLSERIQPPVEQWLRGFYDAEFVVTDSFHACVFSIIFGKPFVVCGNARRGLTRFDSLLGLFELGQCLVTDMSQFVEIRKPDYDSVYQKLATLRSQSNDFIKNVLVK